MAFPEDFHLSLITSFKDPVSYYGQILRSWVLGLQPMYLWEENSAHNNGSVTKLLNQLLNYNGSITKLES